MDGKELDADDGALVIGLVLTLSEGWRLGELESQLG